MRNALISDIHVNFPALDAVLADIEACGVINAIDHAGDLVGYSAAPNEEVERMIERWVAGIAGNYDMTVAAAYTHCDCKSESPWQEELAHITYSFTPGVVSAHTVRCKAGDVIAFGHTHKPWHRVVEGIHLVNTGSVGRPKDGDWRAGYVLLDLGVAEPRVEFVRVAYDVEAAARDVKHAGLPEEFADFLRTGGTTKVVGPHE